MNFRAICIVREPPLNCFAFKKFGLDTLEYVALNALAGSSTVNTVGAARLKLRWLNVLNVSTRHCSVVPSVIFVFLKTPMFQMWSPGDCTLLRPAVEIAPRSAATKRA